MSKQIDERIVQMTFENRAFEQGIQTSITSLKKLDSSLDGLREKGKDSFKISFDMTGLQIGLEKIEQKMTATGIIGKRILENLTDSAMNFANGGVGAIFRQIKEGGKTRAFNIENARFQLMGLLKDAAEVSGVMQNASDSVLDTAYGMDQAAKAASMLAASGMKAGDKMYSSLLAIAGVSAQLNADYDSIANIFTTVAGNGRLMGMQLTQLSTKGLNAAATIADYMDAVKSNGVTASASVQSSIDAIVKKFGTGEAAIRSAVTGGMVSFEMFSEAMSYAFGEHAKDANKTFTGSLSNLKAALSRIGQKFYTPLIDSHITEGENAAPSKLIQLFGTLKERLNDVNKQLDPFAELVTGTILDAAGKLNKYFKNLDLNPHIRNFYRLVDVFKTIGEIGKNVFTSIRSVLEPIGKAMKTVWVSTGIDVIDVIQRMADKIRIFTESLKLTFGMQDRLNRFTEHVLYGTKNIASILTVLAKRLINTIKDSKAINIVITAFKKAFGFIFNLVEKFFIMLERVNLHSGFFSAFREFIYSIDNNFGKVLDAISSKLGAFVGFLSPVVSKVKDFGGDVAESFEEFTKTNRFLSGVFSKFSKTTEESALVAETFEVSLDRLGSSAKKAEIKTLQFGKSAERVANSRVNDLGYLFAKMRGNISVVAQYAKSYTDQVVEKINDSAAGSILQRFIDEIKETYADSGVIGVIQLFGSKLYDGFHSMMAKLYDIIQSPEFKAVYDIFLSSNFVYIMRNISKWGGLIGGSLGKNPLINIENFVKHAPAPNKLRDLATLLTSFAAAMAILSGIVILIDKMDLKHVEEDIAVMGAVMVAFTTVVGSISKLGKDIENSKRIMVVMLAYAVSLGLVVGAMAKIASAYEGDGANIYAAVSSLALLLGMFGYVVMEMTDTFGSSKSSKFLETPGSALKIIATMIVLSAALRNLCIGLRILASADTYQLIGATGTIVLLLFSFVALASAWSESVKKMKPKKIVEFVVVINALSLAVAALGVGLALMALVPFDQVQAALLMVAMIAVTLGGVAYLVSKNTKKSGSGVTAVSMLVASVAGIVIALAYLAKVMDETKVDLTEPLDHIIGLLIVLGVTFIAITALFGNTKTKKMKNLSVIGALVMGLCGIVLAIGYLTKVIKEVGGTGPMIAAATTIGILTLVFGSVIATLTLVSAIAGKVSYGAATIGAVATGIVAFAEAIVALSMAITLMSLVDTKKLGIATGILVGLIVIMTALVVAMVVFAEPVYVASFAVAAMGKAILILNAGLALGAVALAVFAASIMFIAATAVPTLVLGLKSLKIFIEGLCDIIIETAPKLKEALITLLDIVSEAIMAWFVTKKVAILKAVLFMIQALTEYAPQIVNALVDLFEKVVDALIERLPDILSIFHRFLEALYGGLENSPMEMGFITKTLAVITGISVILLVLGKIPGAAIAALKGIAVLGIVIAGLIGIVGACGLIASMPGVNWLIDQGGVLLGKLGEAIGKFIGGIAGGFEEQLASTFVNTAKYLSEGMTNLQPFLEQAAQIDDKTVSGLFKLCEAVILMSAAEFIDGINRIRKIFGTKDDFGSLLVEFGKSFKSFYEQVKDIENVDAVDKICEAIKKLVEAANAIPNSGGFLGLLVGENNIDKFGEMLTGFAFNFRLFMDVLNENGFLDELVNSDKLAEKFEAIKGIIDIMSTAAKAIPNTGGKLGDWLGNNDLDIFAKMMADAAPDIVSFVNSVSGIKASQVSAARNAANALAAVVEVANQVSADRTIAVSNGMFGFAIHEGSGFSTFCKQLSEFGPHIAIFAAHVNGINVDAVTGAANAAKIMAETVAVLNHPENGYSLADKLTPAYFSDLAEMGRDMVKYGKYMAKFSKVVSGKIDAQAMKDSAHFAKAMVEVAAAIQKIDEGRKWYRNDTTIKDFGEMLEDFGKSVKKFYKQVKKIPMEDLTSFVENMQVLTDLARMSATEDLDFYNLATGIVYFSQTVSEGFSSAFAVNTDQVTTVINSLNGLLSSMKAALVSGLADFTSYIQLKISEGLKPANYRIIAYNNVVKALAEGMTNTNAQMTIKSAARNIGNLVKVSLTNTSSGSTMSNIGKNIVRGMVSGMLSMMPLVTSASMRLGAATEKSISSYLGIHSPSKVFHKLGVYTMQGFVDGMSSMDSVVGNTAGKIGSNTFDAMKESIEMMGQAINSDMDTSPRITPILDLDQLRRDAGSIDDMFGGTTFKMASESSNLMQRYVEAKAADHAMMIDNAKVVDAIGALRQDVNSMGMQMNNLQVVMDSGALVGQIARPMDAALGSRMIRREREA